jgi:toxin ParE1/3/4
MDIGVWTLRTSGEDQALRYIDDLEACCQALARNPRSGRPCDHVRPGLCRMEQGKHVVFYRCEPEGILFSRILHQRVLPERHPIDENDPEYIQA